MISRAQRTPLSDWAWTIDRWLLAAIAMLVVAGLVFSMAGSPPVAERLHLPTFYFVNRQALFLLPALAVMFGVSLLKPRHIRRAALVMFVVSLALVVATLFFGQEVKGAKRWIFGIQPSEFLKPAFVVLVAWAFSEGAKRKDVPGNLIALLLFPLTITPLVLQPDFGQTMLLSLVWAILFFMAGLHWMWVAGIGGLGVSSTLLAYKFVPHVHARIQAFLEPPPPVTAGVPTNFQSETALESFIAGSWFRQRSGRRHGQTHLARLAHRLYFRSGRRRVRRHRLHSACGSVRLHRGAQPAVGRAERRPVLPLCDRRPCHAVRPPKLHQHDGEFATHARQGHDLAFRFLRRLFVDLARHGDGVSACRDAQASSLARADAAERSSRACSADESWRGGSLRMSDGPVLLAAGGTGGHLFPAEALAHVLKQRNLDVELVTDERALRYGDSFPARAMHTIQSATPRGGLILERASAVARLGVGVIEALRLIHRVRPRVLVGFGGYPTVPPLVAAWLLRVPTVLHEANGVMGKANRFLAGRVDAIAAGFPLSNVPQTWQSKIAVTGNPLRPNALAAMDEPYPENDGRLRLLVTGGSQGARVMADIVPAAVAALPDELRAKLVIVQQARQEDIARVSGAYERAGVKTEIAPFFNDLPKRIAQAQLVIARSGASTVSRAGGDRTRIDSCAAASCARSGSGDQRRPAAKRRRGGGRCARAFYASLSRREADLVSRRT